MRLAGASGPLTQDRGRGRVKNRPDPFDVGGEDEIARELTVSDRLLARIAVVAKN